MKSISIRLFRLMNMFDKRIICINVLVEVFVSCLVSNVNHINTRINVSPSDTVYTADYAWYKQLCQHKIKNRKSLKIQCNGQKKIKRATKWQPTIYHTLHRKLKKNRATQIRLKIPHYRKRSKSNRKIEERDKTDTPTTYIHYRSIHWLGTGTSIKVARLN